MTRFFLGVVCFFVTACAAPTLPPFTVDTFQNEAPVSLNVRDVQVVSHITKFDRLPHIENKMPVSPESALKSWSKNRFVATNPNSPVQMRVNIVEAYMTATQVDSGAWYKLNNVRYKLTYKVDVQFKKANTIVYTQNVTGWESHSLPQKSALADKEAAWQAMLNAMVQKVNTKIVTEIPAGYKN